MANVDAKAFADRLAKMYASWEVGYLHMRIASRVSRVNYIVHFRVCVIYNKKYANIYHYRYEGSHIVCSRRLFLIVRWALDRIVGVTVEWRVTAAA